ncbi:MAG: BspA family leucine-rich repeat surface protein [Paludibacteraceae bacterium]|nr:BspA family leucine-rich repeat surface protein [Paludibacteraceae bacterium]
MKKLLTLLALGLMVLGAMMNSVSAQEIGAWKGFKSGAATFTFYQNAPCHVTYVAPLFDSYGYEASFYVVTGTITNWSDWQGVADNGHEIGSNGMTNISPISASELTGSKSAINSHITGQNCITVSYPNCQRPGELSTLQANYIAGSDCSGGIIDGAALSTLDTYQIPKIMTGNQGINSTTQITSKMQEAINSKGWVLFLTGGILGKENGNATYSPTSSDALRGALQWAEENGKIWVSSVRNVKMYIDERLASTFALQSETATAATYTLTHSLDNTVCDYDYPLSLRVPLQGWTDIEVKQNGNVIEHTVNGDYIYFDAVPNGGTIVISHAPAAFKEIYAVADDSKMVLYYDDQKASRENVIANWTPEQGANNMSSTDRNVFTTVELDASMQAARPTSTSRWFYSLMNVTRITHLNYLNTSNVTNMSSMFEQCQTLAWLDVSGFDIAKVTSMYNMFNGCRLLNMIYYENDWSLSPKLTSTNTMSMFYGCSQLYGDRGTRYDNAHTDFTCALPDGKDDKPGYFSRKGLETYITIVGSKLTLYYDNRFTERDGASDNWYPDMGTNFLPSAEKAAVTEIEIDASVQNYQPTTTQSWFSGLNNATTITGLNNLNTSKVTNMSSMFSGCSSLTSLDLSGFDVSNLKNTSYMFQNCSALTTIYCNESWYAKDKITSSENMFNGCVSLVGGLGTTYAASNPKDKTYAEPDMISGYPGYFTANGPVIYAVMEGSKMVVYYDANYGAREDRITDWWPEVEGAEGTYHMSNEAKAAVTEIEIDASVQNYQPTTTQSWFSNLRNATTITGLNYLNTSKVKNMTTMFSGCSSLTSLDLSGFNTGNVTNMSGMFSNCSSLTSLNLSSFNTAKVVDMDDMFLNCARLTSLDLKNFNVSSLLNANRMFYGCSALTTIESNRDWNGIVYASAMFEGCTSLVGGNGTAYSAEHTDKTYARPDGGSSQPGYFTGELILPEIYAVKDGTKMVLYYDTQKSSRANVIANWTPEKGALEVSGTEKVNVTEAELDASMQAARPTSTKYWFGGFNHMTSIAHLDYLNTSEATTMKGMFTTCLSLTSLDLSSFNTANVTEMDYMFSGCSSLTTIKCNNDWSASSVLEDSENMFDGCTSLVGGKGTAYDAAHKDATYARPDNGASEPGYFTSTETEPEIYAAMDGTKMVLYYDDQKASRFGVLDKWTPEDGVDMDDATRNSITKAVINASMVDARPTSTYRWFKSLANLTTIDDLANLNTSEVTNMTYMFSGCSSLTSLDLSSFNTDNVTNMNGMFSGCSSLTSLDISNFNTDKVTKMEYMFRDCLSLTSLNLSNFNTANVTSMYAMFYGCSSLTSLDVSSFNTAKVELLQGMFYGCTSLTSLDVSSFNTANVTDMKYMFYRCSSLKTIYCDDAWNPSSSDDMFDGCTSLVGDKGTAYNSGIVDKTYARPDGGKEAPGYFTAKKTGKYIYTLFDEKAHKLTYYT